MTPIEASVLYLIVIVFGALGTLVILLSFDESP